MSTRSYVMQPDGKLAPTNRHSRVGGVPSHARCHNNARRRGAPVEQQIVLSPHHHGADACELLVAGCLRAHTSDGGSGRLISPV
eukprot:scaffold17998_cov30-Tisochrysis_lutea.AAC.4